MFIHEDREVLENLFHVYQQVEAKKGASPDGSQAGSSNMDFTLQNSIQYIQYRRQYITHQNSIQYKYRSQYVRSLSPPRLFYFCYFSLNSKMQTPTHFAKSSVRQVSKQWQSQESNAHACFHALVLSSCCSWGMENTGEELYEAKS